MQKKVTFRNSAGLKLKGVVHIPKRRLGSVGLVALHGFPGHMRGSAKDFCANLEKRGILCMRFDFSGTDSSEGKFENKLMSQEVKDTRSAIDFLMKHYPVDRLVLQGHSTGAIDAALYASHDLRIDRLIISGGLAHLNKAAHYDFTDEQVRDFWTKGYIRYNSPGKWYHGKKLKKGFYDEFFTLKIPESIKRFRKPLLIIHGEEDTAVPVNNAFELYKIARKPKKLVTIKGAGHGFEQKSHKLAYFRSILKFIVG